MEAEARAKRKFERGVGRHFSGAYFLAAAAGRTLRFAAWVDHTLRRQCFAA